MRTRSRGHRQPIRMRSVNMNEMMHIILSLQLMFGSKRGWLALLLLIFIGAGGYFAFQYFMNPLHALEQADRMWDRDQHVEAIREYKALLRKRDPLDPAYAALPREDRPRLYRRIISHEVRYGVPAEARDWIRLAWEEGIRHLDFDNEQVKQLWIEVTQDSPNPNRDWREEFMTREKKQNAPSIDVPKVP